MTADRQLPIILALGTTQTLGWGSSYYLPAILADPIARDLGISSNWFFAAFSASLVIAGLLGPRVGRQIDLVGGRQALSASNIILAAGLALLGASISLWMLAGAWLLLGIGMGLGLYDAAFGTLGRIYGDNARRAITLDRRLCQHRRLAARFARDYRMAGNVLRLGRRANSDRSSAQHVFLPKTAPPAQRAAGPVVKSHIPMDHTMILLSFAFAAAWTVTSAMAAHLPRIVEAFGATPAQAVFGLMIGPAQVAARVLEASTLSRFHPLFSTRLACITHPIGACVIGVFGGGAAAAFALLHGAGNGILTIARGNATAGDLRPGELRLPAGPHRSTFADRPGAGAARIRIADRTTGAWCRRRFVLSEPSRQSSLVFGTLYAEAQRRYLKSVSPYARRLFHQMAVPEVDAIEGLPPAVALQQQRGSPTTRSSVGSVTMLSRSACCRELPNPSVIRRAQREATPRIRSELAV